MTSAVDKRLDEDYGEIERRLKMAQVSFRVFIIWQQQSRNSTTNNNNNKILLQLEFIGLFVVHKTCFLSGLSQTRLNQTWFKF